METSAMTKPDVTIVVVPRERFSYTRESLESLYQDTSYPFKLVYVDGGSPRHIKNYLKAQAREKQFKLIRTEHYLSPNRARNLGLQEVKSKYVVFYDNDVVVTPGWLNKLVQCAEEKDAAVVGPLTCIGKPEHQVIHNAGGVIHFASPVEDETTKRRLIKGTYLAGKPVAHVRDQLHQVQCEYVEFHCVLVRTEVFAKIGPLDEKLLSTREHLDFCLSVAQAGGTIYCERESVITTDTLGIGKDKEAIKAVAGFVQIPGFEWSDIPYFMLRWSNAWNLASLNQFCAKWNLEEDLYIKKRYKHLGTQRYGGLLKPLVDRFPFKEHRNWFANVLKSTERALNGLISDSYARKHDYARHSLGLRQKDKVTEQSNTLVTSSISN